MYISYTIFPNQSLSFNIVAFFFLNVKKKKNFFMITSLFLFFMSINKIGYHF